MSRKNSKPAVVAPVVVAPVVATPVVAAVVLASFTGPVLATVTRVGTTHTVAVDSAAQNSVAVDTKVPRVAAKHIAQPINFARSLVAAGAAVESVVVVKTATGTNTSKAKVYGYDNGVNGGGVPKGALIALVPTAKSPAGVTPNQWALLQTFAGKSVTTAYDGGVASRSVRRAYRAGAIRFVAA